MKSLVKSRDGLGGSQVGPTRALGVVRSEGQRGRMMFTSDIRALLGGRKSDWWIRNHFAPEYRFKVGRDPAWWESDALAWLDGERST